MVHQKPGLWQRELLAKPLIAALDRHWVTPTLPVQMLRRGRIIGHQPWSGPRKGSLWRGWLRTSGRQPIEADVFQDQGLTLECFGRCSLVLPTMVPNACESELQQSACHSTECTSVFLDISGPAHCPPLIAASPWGLLLLSHGLSSSRRLRPPDTRFSQQHAIAKITVTSRASRCKHGQRQWRERAGCAGRQDTQSLAVARRVRHKRLPRLQRPARRSAQDRPP